MTDLSIAGIVLLIINIAVSYKGFKDEDFFEKYKFDADSVIAHKDYQRLISGGFLHTRWSHVIINSFFLLTFSIGLQGYMGIAEFFFIYFSGLIGGNMLALYLHRHYDSDGSVGSFGAVGGLIFAAIALSPVREIDLLVIPVNMPAWAYGLMFLLYMLNTILSRKDGLHYEAHLGGAVTGLLASLVSHPWAIYENYQAILILVVPVVIFIVYIVKKPELLTPKKTSIQYGEGDYYTMDERYNNERNQRQQEIDRILDKISRKGIKSLSKKEHEMLNKYSKDTA